MFKKFVSVCLVMLVMLSQVPFGVFAEETEVVAETVEETVSETADWSYEVNKNGGITLTEYKGNDSDVVIPETIDGYEVHKYAETTFKNTTGITSITFPSAMQLTFKEGGGQNWLDAMDSLECVKVSPNHPDFADFGGLLYSKDFQEIKYIPPMIKGNLVISTVYYNKNWQKLNFKKCTQLTSIELPKKFYYDNYVTFPSDVVIKGYSGSMAEDLAEEKGLKFEAYDTEQTSNGNYNSGDLILTFDSPTNSFKVSGFAENVENVVIPEEVNGTPITAINAQFLGENSPLKAIEIPETITSISISGYSELKEIGEISANVKNITLYGLATERYTVSEENPYFTAIDGVVYNKDLSEIIAVPTNKTDSLIMPKTVTSIQRYVFWNSNLKYIELSPILKENDVWHSDFTNATVLIPAGYAIDNTLPGSYFNTVYIVEKGSEWEEKLNNWNSTYPTVMITYEEHPDGYLVFEDYSAELDKNVLEISDITDTEMIFSRKDLPCDTAGGVSVKYDIYVNDAFVTSYNDNGEPFNYSYPLEFNEYYDVEIIRTLYIEVFNLTKKSIAKYEFDTLRLSEFETEFTEVDLNKEYQHLSTISNLSYTTLGVLSCDNLLTFAWGDYLGYATIESEVYTDLVDGEYAITLYKLGGSGEILDTVEIYYSNWGVIDIIFAANNFYVCYGDESLLDDYYDCGYVVRKYSASGDFISEVFCKTDNVAAYNDYSTIFIYKAEKLFLYNMGSLMTLFEINPSTLEIYNTFSYNSYASDIMGDMLEVGADGKSYMFKQIGGGTLKSGKVSFYKFSENFDVEQEEKDVTHFYTDFGYCQSGIHSPETLHSWFVKGRLDDSAISPTGVACSVGVGTKSLSDGKDEQPNLYAQVFDTSKNLDNRDSYLTDSERSGVYAKKNVTDYGMLWLTNIANNEKETVKDSNVVYYKGLFVIFYEKSSIWNMFYLQSECETNWQDEYYNRRTYYQVIDINGNLVKGETLLSNSGLFSEDTYSKYTDFIVTEAGIQWVGNKLNFTPIVDFPYASEIETNLTLYTLSFEDLTQDTKKDIQKNDYEKIYGDCTEDGVVNIADLVYMHKVFLYGTTYVRSCDLDGDGYLTVLDYAYMKRTLIKKVYAGGSIQ